MMSEVKGLMWVSRGLTKVLFFLIGVSVMTPLAVADVNNSTLQQEQSHIDIGAFLRIVEAIHLGDDSQAAQSSLTALRADPQNSELLHQAFVSNVIAGSLESVPLARRVEKEHNFAIVATMVLGNDAVLHGQWQLAHDYFLKISGDPIGHMLVPFLLAWCQQAQGQSSQAIESLLHVPPSIFAPFYLMHAALIAQISGETWRADNLFDKSYKIMPGYDLLLARSYAALLYGNGHPQKAAQLVQHLLDVDPVLAPSYREFKNHINDFPVKTPREGIAQSYVLLASLLRQQGHEQSAMGGDTATLNALQFNEAARLMLGFALIMKPGLADACLLLAEIQDEEHHPVSARKTLQNVSPNDPLYPVAQFRLAIFDITSSHSAEAIDILQKLAKNTPQQAIIERALGNAYSGEKRWSDAIAAYSSAIDLAARQDNKAVDWTLYFLRGMAYYEINDWPSAKSDVQKALTYNPDEPSLLNFLGYGMTEQRENLLDAERVLRKAHVLDPSDATVTDSLGWVYIKRGRLETGIGLLEKAAERIPDDPQVNYHLGVAYWEAGRKIEAVDEWNVALGLHPEPSDEKKIRQALQNVHAPITVVQPQKNDKPKA